MNQARYLLAIDQGTTSSRAIVFDTESSIKGVAQQEFTQYFPKSGHVEHEPDEIWQTTFETCKKAIEQAGGVQTIAAIGITNQRETTIVWDRKTGKPVYRAIVWQDRRTAPLCRKLKEQGVAEDVTDRTGLLLDPYFSATKIAWILDNVDGAREKAEKGELAFGTVDSYLLWRLTGGAVHATDATNASRTLLFNIYTQDWDDELLRLFNVPRAMMPRVMDSAADFGVTVPELFGAPVKVCGIAGDQHAATIGQGCFTPGSIKSTYGTGCFVMLNTGSRPVSSKNKLLTTVAYRINNRVTYALEGSIFISGAAVQWLRDGLGIIKHAAETEDLAKSLNENKGVYLVPAFTGLGAPHWDPDARGGLFGLTRDTGVAEIVRATLESVAYQTHDLLTAMADDGMAPKKLRIDGGMVANNWLSQFLADVLNLPVSRPVVHETTALGAAWLAGLQVGLFNSLDDVAASWSAERTFEPAMDETLRGELIAGWQDAVKRVYSKA